MELLLCLILLSYPGTAAAQESALPTLIQPSPVIISPLPTLPPVDASPTSLPTPPPAIPTYPTPQPDSSSFIEPTSVLLPTSTPIPMPDSTQNANISINLAQTGTASAVINAITIVNTIAGGGQPSVTNYTQPTNEAIQIVGDTPCSATSSAAISSYINNANIQANVRLNTVPGANAPLNSTVNVFNMANTTLTGSCWQFLVMNFFAPHTGDLTLPSYQNVLEKTQTNAQFSLASPAVRNATTVTNNLTALTNTGIVNAPALQTGSASTTIRTQEVLNTTLSGNNWLLLTIRSFGGWNGSLINWPGKIIQTPTETIAFIPPASFLPTFSDNFFVRNDATVENTVSATANSSGEYNLSNNTTENANATIQLYDLLNTTVTGNNWYFAYITIFDSFTGNIVFPQADRTMVLILPRNDTQAIQQSATVASLNVQDVPLPPTEMTTIPTVTPYAENILPTQSATPSFHGISTASGRITSTPPPPEETKREHAGFFFSSSLLVAAILKRYQDFRKQETKR